MEDDPTWKILIIIPFVLYGFFWLRGLSKDSKMESKGYRRRYFARHQSYIEPDPKQKEPMRDYWERNGYRWSEKQKRWYKPKRKDYTDELIDLEKRYP